MTIQLAYEMPHSYLSRFGETPYQFCLTHLAEQNKEYLKFYVEQARKGKHVILDNSVFELGKAVETERILDIYQQFPDNSDICLVAPDAFSDGPATEDAVKSFISELKGKYGHDLPQIMGVVQGKDWDEWLKCYVELTSNQDITKIGIPYHITFDVPGYGYYNSSGIEFGEHLSHTRKEMMRRIFLFEKLMDLNELNEGSDHHLLGTSDPLELYYQSAIDCIKSCDTSVPFVQAWADASLTQMGLPDGKDKVKRPENYFDLPYDAQTAGRVSCNLTFMKMWARGRRA